MRAIAFLALISTAVISAGARAGYTLADLEVLSREGSHAEFFAHALDVRPSERGAAWKEMVSKMGGVYSKELRDKGMARDDFKRMEELYRWPALKTDEVFRARRQE